MSNLFSLSYITALIILISVTACYSQKDSAAMKTYDRNLHYYNATIMKSIDTTSGFDGPKYRRKLVPILNDSFPTSILDYPNQIWHNKAESQGNTGTCWCYATTSFYESEVYRLTNQKVELSEMYTVYYEYVEKASEFINTKGQSFFGEGSEANAVKRMYDKYGVVPKNDYTGYIKEQAFFNHDSMFGELKQYLLTIKTSNSWNEDTIISTVKSILNKHMGPPPTKIKYKGKKITPKQYLSDILKLNMDDYIDVLSYKQEPYYTQCIYNVPDNWWKDSSYYNVPLDEFMAILDSSIFKGYSVALGGDVSEAGFLTQKGDPQVAIIPSFDIPSEYIDENARQFRFSNKSTTDDHGMHVIGMNAHKGENWYLLKDSGSGSRNKDIDTPEFGYYFFREDYVKLKMMDFHVHKDVLSDIIHKFNN